MSVDAERSRRLTSGLRVEYLSLGYNVLEAVVGISAGVAAGSIALIGFGLDSVVEGASAGILVWRLKAETSGRRTPEDAEKRAIRLVAVAFFVLALYVGVAAVIELVRRIHPEPSGVGLALAVTSLIVMPLLARRKKTIASALNSRSLEADSHQTVLCTYLSAVLLFGLLLNTAFGWWWADAVAALGIAGLAAIEGAELWRTEDVCCS